MSLNEDVPIMLTSSTTAVVLSRSMARLSADITEYTHPLVFSRASRTLRGAT